MLDAIESRFSTQYRTPTPIVGAQGNSAISITARPIVSGAVPVSSTPPITGVPVVPTERPLTGFYLDPVEAPIKPAMPITAPSASGVLSDGSAGVQVTSGISGSHDAVGINAGILNSLASIGVTNSTTGITGAPTATPTGDNGYGMWILAAVAIGAIWFVLK